MHEYNIDLNNISYGWMNNAAWKYFQIHTELHKNHALYPWIDRDMGKLQKKIWTMQQLYICQISTKMHVMYITRKVLMSTTQCSNVQNIQSSFV